MGERVSEGQREDEWEREGVSEGRREGEWGRE